MMAKVNAWSNSSPLGVCKPIAVLHRDWRPIVWRPFAAGKIDANTDTDENLTLALARGRPLGQAAHASALRRSSIDVFVAAGAEKAVRHGRPGEDALGTKPQACELAVDLRGQRRLVGVSAQPVMDVVVEVHATGALEVGEELAKAAAPRQRVRGAVSRNIAGACQALRQW